MNANSWTGRRTTFAASAAGLAAVAVAAGTISFGGGHSTDSAMPRVRMASATTIGQFGAPTPTARRLATPSTGQLNAASFAPLKLSDGTVVEAKSTMRTYLTSVLLNVDTFWKASFKAGVNLPVPSVTYQWPAKGESLASRCGATNDRTGQYCSLDDTITVNEEYARKLWVGQYDLGSYVRQGDPGGDFGVATLVAHEYGHQVQDEMGWNKLGLASTKIEQDADCLAGIWAHYAYGVVQAGDITKAYAALTDLADDATTDQNHGTAAQRNFAFHLGYSGGQTSACTSTYLGR